ncbi:MAG: hypothetical protein KJ896_05510, partial [Nanoarchaeota archaeon]|nr:hypothetical protein [Nanoarchaeota archaeon]
MALFAPQQAKPDLDNEVNQLRSQGLTDQQIIEEMNSKGIHEAQVISALNKINGGVSDVDIDATQMNNMPQGPDQGTMYSQPQQSNPASSENLYERIEEITESMIDEKWDELIAEVR